MTPIQKLPKNVGDLAKLIVAKDFKELPKVQKIAQSGHTGSNNEILSFPWGRTERSRKRLVCGHSNEQKYEMEPERKNELKKGVREK